MSTRSPLLNQVETALDLIESIDQRQQGSCNCLFELQLARRALIETMEHIQTMNDPSVSAKERRDYASIGWTGTMCLENENELFERELLETLHQELEMTRFLWQEQLPSPHHRFSHLLDDNEVL